MKIYDSMPKAIFGDNLWGTKAMRFVFVDEAGTSGSEHEVVRIVAALPVDADNQLVRAEAAVKEALHAVPSEFKPGFVFHAEEIWSARKYRDRWALSDRRLLLHSVMSIPKKLGIPICFALCWADAEVNLPKELGLKDNEEHHFYAFRHAVSTADRFIRKSGRFDEVGTIVAERNDLQKYLSACLKILRDAPFTFPPGTLAPTEEEKRLGYVKQDGTMMATRIRPVIHWVEKQEDPLVWLADACAFGLKRYFADKPDGDDFCMSLLGHLPPKSDFKNGPVSGKTYWHQPITY